MSDWYGFASYLSPHCHYTNTQFDREEFPDSTFLDITDPPLALFGSADAIICSEVLEHVAPPVQRAFNGLFALLRPGGTLILTVPYKFEQTIEHFPELYDWRIEERNGMRVLVNRTHDGVNQLFEDLKFHGGGKSVLEMRLFGLDSILEHLSQAGFEDTAVIESDVLKFGIRLEPWSRAITARRPRG